MQAAVACMHHLRTLLEKGLLQFAGINPHVKFETTACMHVKLWEYKIERAHAALTTFNPKNLNKLGKEGWEAVGIFYDVKYSQSYVLLKRESKTT